MNPSIVNAKLTNSSAALKVLKDVGETLTNVPYIKAIAGASIQILEIREQITTNKELCCRLIDNVAARSAGLVKALENVTANSDLGLEDLEEDLRRYEFLLADIRHGLLALTPSFLHKVKAVFYREEIKKELQEYSSRLSEFDSVFSFARLVNIEAKIDTLRSIPTRSSRRTVTKLAPPPLPSTIFTGRADILNKMNNYFTTSSTASNSQRVFTLYGLGGAGKTQIGLKFVQRFKSRFSKIYFIDASTTETLTAAFQTIGADARLPEATVTSTICWLSNLEEEWLLFFDNADDPSLDLRSFIPPCSHGNILITSRNPEMRRHAPEAHCHVGGLEFVEAMSLLLRSSMLPQEDPNEKCMGELVEELGFLALAIVQAGAFISSCPGMSFEGYLQLYRTNRATLLRQHSGQRLDGYHWTVYTTWDMSFRKLDPLAARVLQLSSFWHYDRIPKAFLQRALTEVEEFGTPEGWNDAAVFLANFKNSIGEWDELTFQRVISQLNSFSVLASYWNDSYSTHPLVHSWARDCDENQSEDNILAARLLALSTRNRAFCLTAGPHVRAWMALQRDVYACLDSELAWRFGNVCLDRRWFMEAEQLFLLALERRKDDPTVMGQLSLVYFYSGRLAEGERLLVSAVEKGTLTYGAEHLNTLTFMANLAVIYADQGRLEDAEQLEALVLERRKKTLGVPSRHATQHGQVGCHLRFSRPA